MIWPAIVADKQRGGAEKSREIRQAGRADQRMYSFFVRYPIQHFCGGFGLISAAYQHDMEIVMRYQKIDQRSKMSSRPLPCWIADPG